jgi:hypothetical protein
MKDSSRSVLEPMIQDLKYMHSSLAVELGMARRFKIELARFKEALKEREVANSLSMLGNGSVIL